MDQRTVAAVDWLLSSDEPAIRLLTRRHLLGRSARNGEGQVLTGAKVRALFAGQQADGGFGNRPYRKWTGAHWRLVSMVELGVPANEPRAVAAAEQVLRWLTNKSHLRVTVVDGLPPAAALP